MDQLGPNALGETLEPGRVGDCYLGLLLPPRPAGELPELVVTWAARLAGTEDALLWLVEPERQRLPVRYGIGRFAASAGRSLHSGEGLAGQAWQTGAPLAVTGYRCWPGRLREAGSQHELQAALCLPLRWDGEVIGVLGVATSKPGRVFRQPEIQQLGGLLTWPPPH